MGILSGNPKDEPMHYGEVSGIWAAVLTAQSAITSHQIAINHTGDKDLKKLLEEAIEQARTELKELEPLLKENGVGLPPAPPERPDAKLEDIPVGARMQDPEISATASAGIAAGLVACSDMMGMSIREDIITMFANFHNQKATLGGKFLRLNKEKGWIVHPPLHPHQPEDK
ncbi:DUF3231 family protein [Lentibacillus sediminis]|uniref:DUF3231 family protein n=1 Tax=Lentibacillus sediminis TaxID=1940529 RepID=UPI000C1C465B|nr:DUF3231 family protein [Lentibacillus sediminis]